MFIKKIFSKYLISLRQSNGLNQSKMSEILAISQTVISKLENGERAASIELLYALADHFNSRTLYGCVD
ncbi:helix-turn-helix domain-containing protein [Monoglobus pectinilyticus]|jgi:transcriptional regulator with XRE-family HTH domain|uniref:helix-turn-helix domain-containing protein n=1 Tax=Monoglobus pectinilyticus TaxID=1981510 RepID=UPI000D7ACA7E|nr:MAG: XRE family transcriptional regulator [Clostridiales bacterium]